MKLPDVLLSQADKLYNISELIHNLSVDPVFDEGDVFLALEQEQSLADGCEKEFTNLFERSFFMGIKMVRKTIHCLIKASKTGQTLQETCTGAGTATPR